MADSSERHPYGTCEGCGCDLWECRAGAGDTLCYTCKNADKVQEAKQRLNEAIKKAKSK